MKKLIEIIAYSNVWISLGAAGLAWMYYQLTNLKPNLVVLGFLFSSTLLTYTFQRFAKFMYQENIQGPRMDWMQRNLALTKIILGISLASTTALAFWLSWTSLGLLSVLAVISFFYAYKFELRKSTTNLRDIPGIKILLIGLVWACSSVVIPAIEAEQEQELYLNFAVGAFLYIVAITIPFDIRDIDYDEKSKKTLPQILGEKWSIFIAICLLFGSYFALSEEPLNDWKLALYITLSALIVLGTKKSRNELYFSFVTDGLLVFCPLGYYLLNTL